MQAGDRERDERRGECAGAAEQGAEEDAGEAQRQDVDGRPDDDLIRADADAQGAEQDGQKDARPQRGQRAEPGAVRGVGAGEAGQRPGQHHALDADIDHARLLDDQFAQRRQQQRHGEADADGEQAGQEEQHAVNSFACGRSLPDAAPRRLPVGQALALRRIRRGIGGGSGRVVATRMV